MHYNYILGKILLNWEKNLQLGIGPYFGPMRALEKAYIVKRYVCMHYKYISTS